MFKMMLLAAVAAGTDSPAVHEADAFRFPQTAQEAFHGYQVAGKHHDWLTSNTPWQCDWIEEARWRRRAWDLLDDLRRVHPLDADRCRLKLVELRTLIGQQAYGLGTMPDYLPLERFVNR